MKISELKVGETAEINLVVKTATLRMTKTNKQYLQMELFDGIEDIQANDWNFVGEIAPPKNTVLEIIAQVTEYMSKKQLTITTAKRSVVLSVTDFMPKGPVDIQAYYAKAEDLIETIELFEVKSLANMLLETFKEEWMMVPGAKSVHHAYLGGTLKHSVDVTIKALALSNTCDNSNNDLCILGGLFHDIGKLWTYQIDGVAIDYTPLGTLLDHIPIGLSKVGAFRTLNNTGIIDLLQHIIASHHGLKEWGSPVTPGFIEAWFIHLADMADAKAETIGALAAKTTNNFTDREWSLDNKPALTPDYVKSILLNGGYYES